MGKTFLTPRHSLNSFFRSPSQLNVRTGGSQRNGQSAFAFDKPLSFDPLPRCMIVPLDSDHIAQTVRRNIFFHKGHTRAHSVFS